MGKLDRALLLDSVIAPNYYFHRFLCKTLNSDFHSHYRNKSFTKKLHDQFRVDYEGAAIINADEKISTTRVAWGVCGMGH